MKKLALVTMLLLFSAALFAQVNLETGNPSDEHFSTDRLNRIDQLLQRYIDSGWIAGAAGFIARDGKIVYDKAFGLDSKKNKTVLKTDALFRIASQTKALTSVAVMMLFEEGKLLLDDPVSKFIPSFAHPQVLDQFHAADSSYTTIPAKREITIRDLLTHTSGIDYPGIGADKMKAIYAKAGIPGGFVKEQWKIGDQMIKLGRLPLAHQPGEKWTYGLNMDVLGYLVEVLSGMTLDQFFKQRIFEPLGMNDSYFYIPAAKQARLAAVHTEDKQHQVQDWPDTAKGLPVDYPKVAGTYYSGGAGVSATIKDYAIFLQMLLNGGTYNGHRLLARHTVDLMTTNQIGDLKFGKDQFGLGFQLTTKEGSAKLGQSEGCFEWGGFFGTTYWVDPKEKLVCLIYTQQVPLSHGQLPDQFKVLVYQSLND